MANDRSRKDIAWLLAWTLDQRSRSAEPHSPIEQIWDESRLCRGPALRAGNCPVSAPEIVVHILGLLLAFPCGLDRLRPWNRTGVRAACRRGWCRSPRWLMGWPPRTSTACPTPPSPSRPWGCGGWCTAWRASGSGGWPPSTAAAPPGPSRASRPPRLPAGCATASAWAPAPPTAPCGPPEPCSAAPSPGPPRRCATASCRPPTPAPLPMAPTTCPPTHRGRGRADPGGGGPPPRPTPAATGRRPPAAGD
jgi:hypothetical protein